MVMNIIEQLGSWNWIIFGLILLGLEILAPGTFFLWFGLSALVVGVVTLIVGTDSLVWVWQAQLVTFLILSLVTAIVGRRMMVNKGWDKSENPMLNERGSQLVGRMVVLNEAITQGRGRAKIDDTVWQVAGPDLPKGANVRITGSEGGVLHVKVVD